MNCYIIKIIFFFCFSSAFATSVSSLSDESTFVNPLEQRPLSSEGTPNNQEVKRNFALKTFISPELLSSDQQLKNKIIIDILNEMPIFISQKCVFITNTILNLLQYEKFRFPEYRLNFLNVLFSKIEQFYNLERVKFLFYTQKILQSLTCENPEEIVQRLFEFMKSLSIEKACFCVDNVNYLCGINSISPSHRRTSWPSMELNFSNSPKSARTSSTPLQQEVLQINVIPQSEQSEFRSPLRSPEEFEMDRFRTSNMSFLSEQFIYNIDDYFKILNDSKSINEKFLSKSVDDTLKIVSKHRLRSPQKVSHILKKMGAKNSLLENYDPSQRKKMDVYFDKKLSFLMKLCPKTNDYSIMLDTIIESIEPHIYEKGRDYVRWQLLIYPSFLSVFNNVLKNTEHSIKIIFAFMIVRDFYYEKLKEKILQCENEAERIIFLDHIYLYYNEISEFSLETFLESSNRTTLMKFIESTKKPTLKPTDTDIIDNTCADFSCAIRLNQQSLGNMNEQESLENVLMKGFCEDNLLEKRSIELDQFISNIEEKHQFSRDEIIKNIIFFKGNFNKILILECKKFKEINEEGDDTCCFSLFSRKKKINERDVDIYMECSVLLNYNPFLKKPFKSLLLSNS